MKKILVAILAAATLFSCTCNNKKVKEIIEDPLDGPIVIMNTTKGIMKIKLYNATPGHRDNFIKLVKEGYYDGIRFHRVIDGFMIQAGDPLSKVDTLRNEWGTGGPGYTVAAEFVPEIHHCKGALAAARLGDMANPRRASSGSQFYIVQSEDGCRHLDGQYTVFGQVVEGMEVIDMIASVATDSYDRPLEPVVIIKVELEEPEVPMEQADSASVCDSVTTADSVKTE